MFLLANAGVVVGAAMLYWLSKFVSNKASRIFIATAIFALVFALANNYVKIVWLLAAPTAEDQLSLAIGLVTQFAVAAVLGGVSLYLLVKNEEQLDNWILVYISSVIIMLFL